MATLAEINETLRDQTSSIEDGTRTTKGLRDRFGEFLDAAQKAGDSREDEIEERQKERRKRIIASRPTSFTQGLTRGLGFGNGFGFGEIAQKILGAMGVAAGTIGLGAGKLLRFGGGFGAAIAVMSKFGEQAIGGLVDYVDKEIDGLDFSAEAKETLTKGGQFALAARFAGIKSPLGLAMAGLVGAYGEETMRKVNAAFGNEDGVYTIPGTAIDIDTESQAFLGALGLTMASIAPALLKFVGKRLALALALLPIGRGVKALSAALALAMGIPKAVSGGALPDPDEIKKNKKPPVKPKPIGGSAAASRLLKFNNPLGKSRLIPGTTKIKPAFPKNPGYVGRGPDGKFMSFNNPLGESKVTKAGGISSFLKSVSKFDDALRLTTKAFVPLGIAAEVAFAQNNPNFDGMDPVSKSAAGVLTSPLSLMDSLQNLYATANNLTNKAVNFGLDAAGIDYQLGMMSMADTAGTAQRAINRGYVNYLENPSAITAAPPNIGLSAEGFITDALSNSNPPVNFRSGDTNVRNDTIIQGVGQVISPADQFLIQID